MDNVIAAARLRSVRRIVFCSSWSSYGRQPGGTFVDESTKSLPNEDIEAGCCCGLVGPSASPVPYFQCKYELELKLQAAASVSDPPDFKATSPPPPVEAVILQPCSILGRFGDTGWCQIFDRLKSSGGAMPGLAGSSSFVDVQDLAKAFVTAADAGPGRGKKHASNLEMQREMARLVGVSAPPRATPTVVLSSIARWNETLLHLHSSIGCPARVLDLQVMPGTISSPWLVAKIAQDQGAHSDAAQRHLNFEPRPLRKILTRNFEWLVATGKLQAQAPALPPRTNGIKRD